MPILGRARSRAQTVIVYRFDDAFVFIGYLARRARPPGCITWWQPDRLASGVRLSTTGFNRSGISSSEIPAIPTVNHQNLPQRFDDENLPAVGTVIVRVKLG